MKPSSAMAGMHWIAPITQARTAKYPVRKTPKNIIDMVFLVAFNQYAVCAGNLRLSLAAHTVDSGFVFANAHNRVLASPEQ